jgi:hypothetical protein
MTPTLNLIEIVFAQFKGSLELHGCCGGFGGTAEQV